MHQIIFQHLTSFAITQGPSFDYSLSSRHRVQIFYWMTTIHTEKSTYVFIYELKLDP